MSRTVNAKPNNNGHSPTGTSADALRKSEAQPLQETDQPAAKLDQTGANSKRATSASEQLASDTDRELADREQDASDRVQDSADRKDSASDQLGIGGRADDVWRDESDTAARERGETAASRARTTARRMSSATQRDEVADLRDRTAAVRDHTAAARDKAAVARDDAALAREPQFPESGNLLDLSDTLRTLQLSSAARRQHSELERVAAAGDREAAAVDRRRASIERRLAGLDELTGVFRRGMGEMALTHEIERSHRTGGPLVFAMIDVDALKATNDQHGHSAGDALLREVGAAIASTLRSYDVTVRWGGDEFVCALSGVTLDVAAERVQEIQAALTTVRPEASLSAGLAELGNADNLESVILRADSALYDAKTSRQT